MQINQQLVERICQISKQAGARILEIYDTNFTVDSKADNSPLTAADIEAHNIICASLKELSPELPVLSEESMAIPYDQRQKWQHYWLVDPLDGTREFIKRNGEFTVNIALIENHQTKLGVVYVPVTRTCYYAASSLGAGKINATGLTESIQTKSSCTNKIIFAGSRSYNHAKQQALVEQLDNAEIITTGSSLKFCLVAEGKVDIYPRFGFTSEWDTAAAQCIVEEAGGCVVDMQFNPLRYNTKDSLLNPEFLVIADPSFKWQHYLEKI